MKTLAFDTSSRFLTIALLDNTAVKKEVHRDEGIRHSEVLIPEIKAMLDECKWDAGELDLICCGLGPGSFTGLRIAVSALKGLSMALNCKIVGVPTMDAIAMNFLNEQTYIAPLLDARKGKVYSCVYKCDGKSAQRVGEYELVSIEELLKSMKIDVTFVGDAVSPYKDVLDAEGSVKYIENADWYPKAKFIGEIGIKLAKDKTDDPMTIEPLYMHSQDCNITKKV